MPFDQGMQGTIGNDRHRRRMRPVVYGWLACVLAAGLARGAQAQIRSDEVVQFFPTAARLQDDGRSWVGTIHGWIYEPEEDDFLRSRLIHFLLQQFGEDATATERERLAARARLYLVDSEGGKRIDIRIGDQTFPLARSGPDGHFESEITLTDELVGQSPGDWLRFTAITEPGDDRQFAGHLLFVPATGISVVSDLDDTIKISEATNRRQLMVNTFLRDFEAVPGMAEKYQQWRNAGAVFHYVSASTWQLYQPLADFMQEAGFPRGTMHLKYFRIKDRSLFDLFTEPREVKLPVIESLVAAYPGRRFVLVGDSGQQDPELYGEIARRHPHQVVRIYIRDITGEKREHERYQRAFADVPAERWELFNDPSRLVLSP